MTPKHKEFVKIKCEHCGYKWNTESKHMFITCPNCYKKTKNPKYIKPLP